MLLQRLNPKLNPKRQKNKTKPLQAIQDGLLKLDATFIKVSIKRGLVIVLHLSQMRAILPVATCHTVCFLDSRHHVHRMSQKPYLHFL